MKTTYEHYRDNDFKIGGAWINRSHVTTNNIQVYGPPRHGKTTIIEHLILRLLSEPHAPGLLHLDPTGDGYEKLLGWASEGKFGEKKVWLVNTDAVPLRYNPLLAAKADPALHLPGLYEALHLLQDKGSSTQFRQMRRHVLGTLHALTENNLTLADGSLWLMDETMRTKERIDRIRDPVSRLLWSEKPSAAKLESSEGWFHVFTEEPLKSLFAGDGFSWDEVYDSQAMVLVNLGARSLGISIEHRKGIAAIYIMGLFLNAFYAKQKRPWMCCIDDATDFTPPHVAPMLVTSVGHQGLGFIFSHHDEFEGDIQRRVDKACATKFFFGPMPPQFAKMSSKPNASYYDSSGVLQPFPEFLGRHRCLYVRDEMLVDVLNPDPTPTPQGDARAFEAKQTQHLWYGAKSEPLLPVTAVTQAQTSDRGADSQSARSRARKSSRNQ